jgi:putative membrane protein
MALSANPSDDSTRKVAIANGVICTVALAFLVWLIYFHESEQHSVEASHSILLPAINAALNATSASLLAAGLLAIKSGRRVLHKRLMLAAFGASTAFLINYIVYHYTQGDTHFPGTGGVKVFYLGMLFSHIILSAVALPMILWTMFLALTDRFLLHKRWAKWTWGLWMYVSVTGVLVFLMLHVMLWT